MLLGYLLLIVVPVAAVAYLLWSHKRRTAERSAAASGRLQELLIAGAQPESSRTAEFSAAASDPPSVSPVTPVVPAAPVFPSTASVASPALYAIRKRVLTAPQTLLYYLLRTGLPDHVVLARVSLAALLDAGPGLTGFAREEQLRRLAALSVDFVVVDKGMQPVAAIDLTVPESGGAARADRDAARSRLAAAGVRYLELDPAALPRKDALRILILDEGGAETSPSASTERAG